MDNEIEGFLFNNYFMFFYALALVLSLFSYRKYFDSVLKYLPIIIGYTLFSELIGYIIREYDDIQVVYLEGYSYYNILVFNIFDIVFFLYFFYIYRNEVSNIKFKNWIKYGVILFIACSVVNPFFQDFLLYPQMFASTLGSIVLIMSIVMFFLGKKSLVNAPNHQILLFWISWGLLIFYLLYPFILYIGYFVDYELYKQFHVRTIHHLLIVVMYSCFILGFILMSRKRPTEDI